MAKKLDYITPSRLKGERGWTDGLIKRFLGEPDDYAINPHYRSGPMMRLYLLDRVIEAEATAEYQATHAAKAESRIKGKIASQAAANRKRSDLLDAIERLQVSVIVLPPEKLLAQAIQHYNDLWAERGKNEKRASPQDSQEFLTRITCNFIRHQLVSLKLENGDEYWRDAIVASLHGRVGKADGYDALYTKVAIAIMDAYPDLDVDMFPRDRLDYGRG